MEDTSRRHVLAAAATGSAFSLAGCAALDNDDDEVPEDGPADADDGEVPEPEGEAAATIAVDVEARMAEIEAEISERVEEGEIDQEEAQAELQEAQLEAVEEGVGAAESFVEGIDGVTTLDSNVQAGAILVDGDAAAILETLDGDDVAALLSAAEFDALR
ncbi:hypothetical protein [Halorubrum vacuolatum]|uniref:Uncharacterized protein n=1 Tax=Halorubrum vacuolatum TaxID=63740 RepID=A0A238V9Z3_HALVU|nr:hypothetical protein [Halorubrum vacuolatum]SNR31028.1 hypothetical protein SAMN06264855_102133 [Halorubrum vacuolatum]